MMYGKKIFLASLLCVQFITAQNTKKDIDLLSLIVYLENTFNIKFSYNSDLIANETLENIDLDSSLSLIFSEMEKQTSVFVEKVNDRYFLIKSKKSPGTITVCGTFVDKFTLKQISGVEVKNLETGRSVFSNDNGFFEFYRIKPSAQVLISAIGYQKSYKKAGDLQNKVCQTIELEESSTQLDEVLISDYLKDDLDRLGTTDEISFNPNEIGVLPSLVQPDVLETLQILPGIQSTAESASELLVRGGNPDKNLILLDGIKIYNNSHLFGSLSVLNPHITEKIDLYRGDGLPSRFGGAIGGVISVTSVNDLPKKISGSLGSSLVISDFNIQIPLGKKIGFIAAARTSLNTLLENDTFAVYANRVTQNITISEESGEVNSGFESDFSNDVKFYDFSSKLIFTNSTNNHFSISNFFNYNSLDTRYIFKRTADSTLNGQEDYKINKEAYGIAANWEYQPSTKSHFFIGTTLSHYFNEINKFSKNFPSDRETEDDGTNVVKDYTTYARTLQEIGQKSSLEFGYEFTNLFINNSFLDRFESVNDRTNTYGSGKKYSNNHAAFAKSDVQIFDFISLETGIRAAFYSFFEKEKIYLEPRLVSRIKLNNAVNMRLSYARSNQTIHQLSFLALPTFTLEANPWTFVDESLYDEPIGNDQYSAGIILQTKSWDVNIDTYLKNTKNINTGLRGFQQIREILLGDAQTWGIDALIKKRIRNYRSILSYSYIDQSYQFSQLSGGNSFSGNFDISHSISWTHTYKVNSFEFAAGWQYQTGLPYTNWTENSNSGIYASSDIIIDENFLLNQERLKEYHRLDISSSYTFDLANDMDVKLTLSLLNIYDRKNQIGVFFEKERIDPNNSVEESKLFLNESLGFTPNVAFRFNF